MTSALSTNSPPKWAGVSRCEVTLPREPVPKAGSTTSDLYAGSVHVAGVDLMQSSDCEIWDFVKANGFVVVSTDLDVYDLATTLGPPPKVVWLRRWTHPTADAERVLRRDAIRIAEFVDDPELGVLVLDRD